MNKLNTLKKLGLVGGTGPESTAIYYRELNRIINQKTGGKAFPELCIESVDLYRTLGYCKAGDDEALVQYLLDAVKNLVVCGADFAALTANTVHSVFDRLSALSPIPLVSIVDAVCEEAFRRGYRKIGLWGTIYTMNGAGVRNSVTARKIELVTPPENEKSLVNSRIADELELGIVKDSTVRELVSVIQGMKERDGIEAVILGCTELPLALNDKNCSVPCLDTMKIHIDTLSEMVLGAV